MNSVTDLWLRGYVPIVNGICFADEHVQYIDLITYPNKRIMYNGKGSLKDFIENTPDDITSYDIYGSTRFESQTFHYGCGSYEGDGYLISLDNKSGQANWLFFSDSLGAIKAIDIVNSHHLIVKTDDELSIDIMINRQSSKIEF